MAILLLLAACGNGICQEEKIKQRADTQNSEVKSKANVLVENESSKIEDEIVLEENTAEKSHILVAYFTRIENVVPDDMDAITVASVKSSGNVVQLAQWIGSETDSDLFSIQVTEPYPADWDDCLPRANEEKAEGAHPTLIKTVEDISDNVFLVYQDDTASAREDLQSRLNELQ